MAHSHGPLRRAKAFVLIASLTLTVALALPAGATVRWSDWGTQLQSMHFASTFSQPCDATGAAGVPSGPGLPRTLDADADRVFYTTLNGLSLCGQVRGSCTAFEGFGGMGQIRNDHLRANVTNLSWPKTSASAVLGPIQATGRYTALNSDGTTVSGTIVIDIVFDTKIFGQCRPAAGGTVFGNYDLTSMEIHWTYVMNDDPVPLP